jgi:hypothetical protein
MTKKITFIVGLTLGYILGSRAGIERYEQIKLLGRRVRDMPLIARPIDAAAEKTADVIRAKGNEISDAVAVGVKEKVFGTRGAEIVVIEEIDAAS